MNRLYKIVIFLQCCLLFSACNYDSKDTSLHQPPDKVMDHFQSWWNYHNQNIHFSENYIPLDTNSKVISRESFLQQLAKGNVIPFRVIEKEGQLLYQLFPLNDKTDKDIQVYAKQIGEDAYQKFLLEGMEIPDFHFTDLNGKIYNSNNTKGKLIVLKCWFIQCQACVQEMPVLNEVVKSYRDRPDILFLSMAFDSKEKLTNFLTKTKFNYAVIPVTADYLENKLKVTSYPTHYIINRKGKVSKVMNDSQEMIRALNNELNK